MVFFFSFLKLLIKYMLQVKQKAAHDTNELKSDFFEKVVDADSENKKVITEVKYFVL